ncbi:uncharacterized protein MEPE_05654 [Melanopsichium pennsylvanicum]|uniref:BRCT domain-containing protein n=2 Tax=Melanopsichium pennsylvanicum TaxID=63383 RepID=A0AAJ4XQJ2_9BASI|nr:putative protein [Melanopsichium pennsylvanicum 4]SNX86945.1 uncharacterized protein MEPE_05654 [Melanopsichium pennsylvanicum]
MISTGGDSGFVEPAPRQPQSDTQAIASSSCVTLDATQTTIAGTRIDLTSRTSSSEGSAAPDAPEETCADQFDAHAKVNGDTAHIKPTPPRTSAPPRTKIFLKSNSPDVPLRVRVPSEFTHTLAKKLQIAIRAHGGVIESRLGKADLILVDPQMASLSKKLLREANQIGQPIPVVTYDYIQDSVAQSERLDVNDPKYKFDGTQPLLPPVVNPVPTSRSLNGRNPFTEADRQAIILFFIDKPEATWSLNAAAKELAKLIPTHTRTSFQSYLQANFEKGWNLKNEVLKARQAALDAEPSELQARILRSQYTASPSLVEQSAPSDGSHRTSSEVREEDVAGTSSPRARHSADADEQKSASADQQDDLEVRQPNPGSIIHDVERSPTKTNHPVDYALSSHQYPGTSPILPGSSQASLELAPGQRLMIPNSPSVDEESDPGVYSATMLSQIRQAESSALKSSQDIKRKRKQKREIRRASRSGSSSEGPELDQLTTASVIGPEADQERAERSESPEWEGSRRLDRKKREKDTALPKASRAKFTKDDQRTLATALVRLFREHGRETLASNQDAVLAEPPDVFWDKLAVANLSHSAASWRSHYLKNRNTYREMVDLIIEDENEDEGEGEGEGENDAEQEVANVTSQRVEEQDQDAETPNSATSIAEDPACSPNSPYVIQTSPAQSVGGSQRSRRSNLLSYPSDGIVVMVPHQPAKDLQHDLHAKSELLAKKQWAEKLSPPPMEEEEDGDRMQVEAEIDAIGDGHRNPQSDSQYVELSLRDDSLISQGQPETHQADASMDSSHDTDFLKESASEAALIEEFANEPSVLGIADVDPVLANQGHPPPKLSAKGRQSGLVDAGTPVLPQHRDAPFYDFTIDSDEEQHIREARSRPSLPNMRHRREAKSAGRHGSPISTDEVLRHFATPTRTHKQSSDLRARPPTRENQGDRADRTREWARSVSATPSSALPNRMSSVKPIVVDVSPRKHANRIDYRTLISPGRATNLSPLIQQGGPQRSRRDPAGQDPGVLAVASSSATRTRQEGASASQERRNTRTGIEAARLQYREEVERFQNDFGLDKEQLRSILMRFKANVKDARNYIVSWLYDMEQIYGINADVGFEYVKTSQGDFKQAENFLRLAGITRESSVQDRMAGERSSSASHSVVPLKRTVRRSDKPISGRMGREDRLGEPSKRYRR